MDVSGVLAHSSTMPWRFQRITSWSNLYFSLRICSPITAKNYISLQMPVFFQGLILDILKWVFSAQSAFVHMLYMLCAPEIGLQECKLEGVMFWDLLAKGFSGFVSYSRAMWLLSIPSGCLQSCPYSLSWDMAIDIQRLSSVAFTDNSSLHVASREE